MGESVSKWISWRLFTSGKSTPCYYGILLIILVTHNSIYCSLNHTQVSSSSIVHSVAYFDGSWWIPSVTRCSGSGLVNFWKESSTLLHYFDGTFSVPKTLQRTCLWDTVIPSFSENDTVIPSVGSRIDESSLLWVTKCPDLQEALSHRCRGNSSVRVTCFFEKEMISLTTDER